MLLMSTETPLSLMVSFISRSCEPCLNLQALVKVVLRSTSKFGRLEHWCIVHFDHIQRSHILEQCSSSTHFWSNHPQTRIGWLWSKRSIILLTKKSLQTPKKCYHKKKTLILRKAYINVFLASIIVRETQTRPCYFFKLSVLILSLYTRNPPFFANLFDKMNKWTPYKPSGVWNIHLNGIYVNEKKRKTLTFLLSLMSLGWVISFESKLWKTNNEKLIMRQRKKN